MRRPDYRSMSVIARTRLRFPVPNLPFGLNVSVAFRMAALLLIERECWRLIGLRRFDRDRWIGVDPSECWQNRKKARTYSRR